MDNFPQLCIRRFGFSISRLGLNGIIMIGLIMCAWATAMSVHADTIIPRSMAGDKGTYYLLEAKRNGNIIKTLHKRVGVNSIGFTRTEIDCTSMKTMELG